MKQVKYYNSAPFLGVPYLMGAGCLAYRYALCIHFVYAVVCLAVVCLPFSLLPLVVYVP